MTLSLLLSLACSPPPCPETGTTLAYTLDQGSAEDAKAVIEGRLKGYEQDCATVTATAAGLEVSLGGVDSTGADALRPLMESKGTLELVAQVPAEQLLAYGQKLSAADPSVTLEKGVPRLSGPDAQARLQALVTQVPLPEETAVWYQPKGEELLLRLGQARSPLGPLTITESGYGSGALLGTVVTFTAAEEEQLGSWSEAYQDQIVLVVLDGQVQNLVRFPGKVKWGEGKLVQPEGSTEEEAKLLAATLLGGILPGELTLSEARAY